MENVRSNSLSPVSDASSTDMEPVDFPLSKDEQLLVLDVLKKSGIDFKREATLENYEVTAEVKEDNSAYVVLSIKNLATNRVRRFPDQAIDIYVFTVTRKSKVS
jgi:hypothetical protein